MKNREKSYCSNLNIDNASHFSLLNSSGLKQQLNIIDILKTNPSPLSFLERVEKIGLSNKLVAKIAQAERCGYTNANTERPHLSENDEKELATEVLLARHTFTNLVFENRFFRQAALTVIQNIYLFRQRKIFFSSGLSAEQERQEALLLFSTFSGQTAIPLAKTFQHLVLARVWHRIINQASNATLKEKPFVELHQVVEQLNSLRNIYMLLSQGLTFTLTRKINKIYQQSLTGEDAQQIGNFGIARAAYRYHPSLGLRFSTYASRWIKKELQRQALDGRLIRISSNLVERISREGKNNTEPTESSAYKKLSIATARLTDNSDNFALCNSSSIRNDPTTMLEIQEMSHLLLDAIENSLSSKSGDVIMRRYGLGPYHGQEQSVIEIARQYQVTRGSIYQLEQTALKKLKAHILSYTT